MLLPRTGDSLDVPYEVFMAWPAPNFDSPVRRTWLVPYATTLAVLSTVLVAIRIGLRLAKKGGGLGLDDAFLLPSYILLILYTAITSYEVDNGMMDRHVYDVRAEVWVLGTKLGWFATIMFSAGTGLLKLSILFFYRRLIKGTYNRAWLITTWVAVGFTISYTIAFVIGLVFTCWPIEAYWQSSDPLWAASADYHCSTWIWGNILSGVFNAVSNLYSVLLPALVLWNLQLPRRQKIGLYVIFTLGGMDVILSCIRTKYMWDFATKYDPSWYGYDATAVSAAEWNVGMICACLPSLRVLFRAFFEYNSSRPSYYKEHEAFRKPPRYVKPRKLNRIESADSELPSASCKDDPQWSHGQHIEEVAKLQPSQKGIVRVREYSVD